MRMSNPSVYADHAATTPLKPEALEAMLPWLKDGFGNPSSLHSFGREARKAVEEARATIAECINANPEEIFFTSGGTEANNWAIKGTTGGLLVSSYEHHSVLNAAESERRHGRFVATLGVPEDGIVTRDCLRDVWDHIKEAGRSVSVASVMIANNEIGSINRISELSAEVHRHRARLHCDAVQGFGKLDIDVRREFADFMTASAHKFGGPKGVGFLYARNGKAPERLCDGGSQERGWRARTENVAGIVGMAAALASHYDRLQEETELLDWLCAELTTGLKCIFPDCVFNQPHGMKAFSCLPGFVSVSIPGHPAEGMLHVFDLKGIAVSAGAACNSKETKVSHVLKAIGLSDELASCTLRISLGPENTEKDIKRILSVFRLVRKIHAA